MKRHSEYNIEGEIREVSDYAEAFVTFDVMLDWNQEAVGPLLSRGRHKDLIVHTLSESCFDFWKRTIRKDSNIFFVKQISKDIENFSGDFAGMVKSYEEFRAFITEAWKDEE